MKKKLLIVTDGKAGHENQSKALCLALGYEYDCIQTHYPTRIHKALSYLCDRLGLRINWLFTLESADAPYAAVVCTGSNTFYPGKLTAHRRGIPVIAILYPRGYRLNFDCILAPTFDRPPLHPAILPIPVNLTATTDAFYTTGVAAFHTRHQPKKPAVALIIGGPNGFASMSVEVMRHEINRLFVVTAGYERWVTTSRRTPPDIEAMIECYPFDYTLLYSRDRFNPVPAFVALCEKIFVTADSTGMISEAVTHGKAQVEVLMNLKRRTSKFARFIHQLEDQKSVHIFDDTLGHANHKIDLAPIIAQIKLRLAL